MYQEMFCSYSQKGTKINKTILPLRYTFVKKVCVCVFLYIGVNRHKSSHQLAVCRLVSNAESENRTAKRSMSSKRHQLKVANLGLDGKETGKRLLHFAQQTLCVDI